MDLQPHQRADCIVSERTTFSASKARRLYAWAVKRQESLSLSFDQLAVLAKDYPSKYRGFARGRDKLERTDFSTIKSIHLKRKRSDWSERDQDNWVTDWNIQMNAQWPLCDRVYWAFDRTSCGLSRSTVMDRLIDYAKVAVDSYGFIFSAPRKLVTVHYAAGFGMPPVCCPTVEEASNMEMSRRYDEIVEIGGGLLLRDVHTVNFLSRPYLDQRVNGTTLEKWIKKDAARGVLEPLTRSIWQWTPPPHNIQIIREELFRAGVVYYYRFFPHGTPPTVWIRDFSKPFVLPAPVPVIFRARYRRIIDP